MAVTSKTTKARSDARKAAARATEPPTNAPDAIELLESDHREVEGYFETYRQLTDEAEKKALAGKICLALKVHAEIEEELLYPKARDTTDETEMVDEALVEHMGAKSLIAQIEAMAPGQPLYDARIKVLGEQIRHHVEEEESELFPALRATRVNLKILGAKLARRKAELMEQFAAMRH